MTEQNDIVGQEGYVSSIKRFMRGDGPGIRTVVFLKGCPLRCIWCSSPQTWNVKPDVVFLQKKCIGCGKCAGACEVGAIRMEGGHRVDYEKCTKCGKCVDACPSKALRFDGALMSADEVMEEALRDASYYAKTGGGVTLSGGEAAVQADFAAELLRRCRDRGVHTAVETCGYVPWENLAKLLPYTQKLYVDLKHMDPEKHNELTGKDNKLILDNVEKAVRESAADVVVNLPLIPGRNDDEENLGRLADFMKGLSLNKIRVLPFHKLGEHEYEEMGMVYPVSGVERMPQEQVERVKEFLAGRGLAIVEA